VSALSEEYIKYKETNKEAGTKPDL